MAHIPLSILHKLHILELLAIVQRDFEWSGGYLIQDVDGCRLEEEHCQNKRQGEEGTLAAAELRQGLLPHVAKRHAHLKPCIPLIHTPFDTLNALKYHMTKTFHEIKRWLRK